MPPIEGLDAIDDAWTNREATTAKSIPERLVIMGGGVVGVEMAQAFQTLGSQVTLVEGERRLLPREEEFACAQVTEALEAYGVDIRAARTPSAVERARRRRSPSPRRRRDRGGRRAARRARPRAADAAASGSRPSASRPASRSRSTRTCRSAATPWLYAIGDVNGRALFTHMGKYQARIAADHILGRDAALSHGADGPLSPARDLHRAAGRGRRAHDRHGAEAGLDVESSRSRRRATPADRSTAARRRHDAAADRPRAASSSARRSPAPRSRDMLHAATIAIVGEVPLDRLRHAVPCFPTRSEIWLTLLEKAGSDA